MYQLNESGFPCEREYTLSNEAQSAALFTTGNGYMGAAARANTRTPGGHPEGYIEAFANIYRNFARTVRARREGREPQPEWTDFPSVEDGIRGMQFIETMVRSGSDPDRKWTDWVG